MFTNVHLVDHVHQCSPMFTNVHLVDHAISPPMLLAGPFTPRRRKSCSGPLSWMSYLCFWMMTMISCVHWQCKFSLNPKPTRPSYSTSQRWWKWLWTTLQCSSSPRSFRWQFPYNRPTHTPPKFCQMRCIGEGLMVKTLDNQLVRMDNLLPWLATSIIKIVGNVFKSEHPYDFSLIPQKTW